MRFFALFLLLNLLLVNAYSQSLQVFSESTSTGAIIYATNTESFPQSVKLQLELSNMTFSEKDKTMFVIPQKSEKVKIGELITGSSGKTKYKYVYRNFMGNFLSKPDLNYIYDLPYENGKAFKMFQGYNGSLSHKGENALDFTMPLGTKILAAREGSVVGVVQSNTESCLREECKKYNNYVTVMHSDGSFASYLHIKYNGSAVKIGDAVKKGDVIAYSGDVGYSNGPHLHFVTFQANVEGRKTLETRFKTGKGESNILLSEGQVYTRDY